MNPKTFATVAALLFVGTAVAMTAPATDAPSPGTVLPPPPTFLGELADQVAPELRNDLSRFEDRLPAGQAPSPAQAFGAIDAVHSAYAQAATPQDALREIAVLSGVSLAPSALGQPATAYAAIQELYALLGETPTPAESLQLAADTAALEPARAQAVAILVQGLNQALLLQAMGDQASLAQAALILMDSADAARDLLAPSAAASSACAVFEDPQRLIWIGSRCDDVLPDDGYARALQVDPAGNDLYLGNSGGASGAAAIVAAQPVGFGFSMDRQIGEVQDNVTLVSINPIQLLLNQTYQSELPGRILDSVAENTDDDQIQFLNEFVAGVHANPTVNEAAARSAVPVALAIDFAGDDVYLSDDPNSQGAAGAGALGILLDYAGSDSYTCNASMCQGSANLAGLGILADRSGSDAYSSGVGSQGSGNAGLLLDFAGNDLYTADFGSQGAYSNALLPRTMTSLLLDAAGDDVYVATELSQGAGGQLVDLAGSDTYTATSLAQGVGIAPRGAGLLLDAAGDDTYQADSEAQGFGSTSTGTLADLAGSDQYTVSAGLGQGATNTPQMGLLYDAAGNDRYTATEGQGMSAGPGVGVLADRSGDDTYVTGRGQGAVDLRVRNMLGVLLDGSGNDSYTAGSNSQGSGSYQGAGLLLDLAGSDHYEAGHNSQGSGGNDPGPEDPLFTNGFHRPHESGVGILLDGVSRAAGATVVVEAESCTESSSYSTDTFTSPGNGKTHTRTHTHTSTECSSVAREEVGVGATGGPDVFEAGAYSQGSSGATGGTGLLLDLRDGPGVSTFTAGAYSQGAATNFGVGILYNAEGDDAYDSPGPFSQGSSDGGVGALLDARGDDTYTSPAADSHGYGSSDPSAPAAGVGLLVDDGGDDTHPDIGDNECRIKGAVGVAVDAEGAAVPTNCAGQVVDTVNQTVSETLDAVVTLVTDTVGSIVDAVNGLLFPPPPVPPTGTVYFYDNVEDAAASQALWSVAASTGVPVEDITGEVACLVDSPVALTEWRIRNATADPQLSPNANTGNQYWFAGLPAGPLPVYGYASCSVTTLTSVPITLPAAATTMTAWIAGSSEATFDFLRVYVKDVTAATTTQVASYDDGFTNGNALPTYSQLSVDLAAYAGHDIQLVFEFTTDIGLADGQGYNLDDVLVA